MSIKIDRQAQNVHDGYMKTNTGNALQEIINRNFEGKHVRFSDKCGLSHVSIGRICDGKISPTLDSLEKMCRVLPRQERKILLLAAARDRIPAEYQTELFGDTDIASEILRANLPADLAAVIRYLESAALNDPTTASYLRRIGQWAGVIDAKQDDHTGHDI